ncbi:50S ribosomal protein L7ae [Candidatus Micrarchaeota archaeon]|nr:50S ribosomal protein L7ae [Candidatus Micrarchaeota archaeon]
MAKSYVKFATPGDLQQKALAVLEAARDSGLARKGTNETTKSIERKEAKLVLIAEDVDPEEIVMHLPVICQEKNVPFMYISTKKELGKAAGLSVGTAAVAVAKAGSAESALTELLGKLSGVAPVEAKPEAPAKEKEEKPKAKKPRKKKE